MKPLWSQTLTWLAATLIALLLAVMSSDSDQGGLDASAGSETPR